MNNTVKSKLVAIARRDITFLTELQIAELKLYKDALLTCNGILPVAPEWFNPIVLTLGSANGTYIVAEPGQTFEDYI